MQMGEEKICEIMESSIICKLRSAKFASENVKHISVKDASKRAADPLPDNVGKKRILGDITNKNVSNKKVGFGNNKKGKNNSHSYIVSEVEKIKIKEETPSQEENKESELSESSENTMYVTALEDSVIDISPCKEEKKEELVKEPLPPGVEDFDKACLDDPFSVPQYVADVFKYYKERETKFVISNYLDKQREMTKSMRAILVDWMVEVQESFELNHETLYLAVKLVDYYLMHHFVVKTKLQLIGATALFIASKYDERVPPLVDDFLYICGDSYDRDEMLETEIKILKTVDYDLGIPLSYRFLRRYARCDRIPMDLLTLARYILETSLMDYDCIDVLDSKIAAAALLLALKMKSQHWTPTLQYYSGYSEEELIEIVIILNKSISNPPRKLLQTIRTKYSHQIFFGVAKIPPLSAATLE
nr:G2/mitotic-specific cyclin-B3 isoform X1 [Parasteatoda tepidariorum]